MHFGRQDAWQQSAVLLPEDRRRTTGFLQLLNLPKGRIRIGAPIWQTALWKDVFYPSRLPPSQYLRYYSQHFDTVELNASFYQIPTRSQVARWCDQTDTNFRFCPKLTRSVSHAPVPSHQNTTLAEFASAMQSFEERLGPIFIQFPDRISTKDWPEIKRFCQMLPTCYQWAIELRHPSWFEDHMLKDPVIDYFYRRNIITVISDTPGRRDAMHLSLTQPTVMIRFLGQFPHGPDFARQKHWMRRLHEWREQGMQDLYFFVHQAQTISIPDSTLAAKRALLEHLDTTGQNASQHLPKQAPLT